MAVNYAEFSCFRFPHLLSSAFKDSRFTGRPRSLQKVMSAFFASSPGEDNGGIVFTHGQQWTEQRRFALKTLRDFGFGKKSMEHVILDEVLILDSYVPICLIYPVICIIASN